MRERFERIRDFNEALGDGLARAHADTLVASNRRRLRTFVEEVGTAVKPLANAGGFGVVRLSPGINTNALIDLLTEEGRRPIQVQRYRAVEGGTSGSFYWMEHRSAP